MFPSLRIAIVADWLTSFGGAEYVVSVFHELFPQAPIFTSVCDFKKHPWLLHSDIRTSFLQKIPFIQHRHQWAVSLMPYVFEQFDFSEYDLVISSSHSCAKGIITSPHTVHVCYCHTPMRYVWEGSHDYVRRYLHSKFFIYCAQSQLHSLRKWDRLAADRVDMFLANSHCVADRIKKYYRRDATVVYPPVDISSFSLSHASGDYYLAVGRLIPYKRFDLLIETFNHLQLPLKIVGVGYEYKKLKKMAGNRVEFLGFIDKTELSHVYAQAKGLVFPQYEDFGIVPIEAMAVGRPVIAYGKGGVCESVIEEKTGIFFYEQSVNALSDVIRRFEQMNFNHEYISLNAQRFSVDNFKTSIVKELSKAMSTMHTF